MYSTRSSNLGLQYQVTGGERGRVLRLITVAPKNSSLELALASSRIHLNVLVACFTFGSVTDFVTHHFVFCDTSQCVSPN